VAPILRTVEYVPPDFATTRDPDGAVMRLVAKAEMAKERARMNVFMMSELQELAATVSYGIEQFYHLQAWDIPFISSRMFDKLLQDTMFSTIVRLT
jgi:hypothetical protein